MNNMGYYFIINPEATSLHGANVYPGSDVCFTVKLYYKLYC